MRIRVALYACTVPPVVLAAFIGLGILSRSDLSHTFKNLLVLMEITIIVISIAICETISREILSKIKRLEELFLADSGGNERLSETDDFYLLEQFIKSKSWQDH